MSKISCLWSRWSQRTTKLSTVSCSIVHDMIPTWSFTTKMSTISFLWSRWSQRTTGTTSWTHVMACFAWSSRPLICRGSSLLLSFAIRSRGEFLCYGGIRRKNNYDYRHSVTCGLGFDTKNSLYKIVQICIQWTQNPAWGSAVFAQIRSAYAYTMGAKINYLISEWKNVAPPAPLTPLKPQFPTYFCGALHWVFCR